MFSILFFFLFKKIFIFREDGKFLNPRNHEKIDEFEISEEGLEELSFEEMLMFSGNSVMVNQMVYSH